MTVEPAALLEPRSSQTVRLHIELDLGDVSVARFSPALRSLLFGNDTYLFFCGVILFIMALH
jgi:hypothetical protein